MYDFHHARIEVDLGRRGGGNYARSSAACFIDATTGAWRGSVEVSGIVALSSAAHCARCGSLMGCVVPGTAWAGVAQEGIALSSGALLTRYVSVDQEVGDGRSRATAAGRGRDGPA